MRKLHGGQVCLWLLTVWKDFTALSIWRRVAYCCVKRRTFCVKFLRRKYAKKIKHVELFLFILCTSSVVWRTDYAEIRLRIHGKIVRA